MTEELKKEAEELIQRVEMGNSMNGFMQLTPDRKQIGEMLVMIAEPREKQITILSKHILELQKDKGHLTDRVRELEAQIEKMKNCKNCKKEKIEGACGHFTQVGWCRDWEMAKGVSND